MLFLQALMELPFGSDWRLDGEVLTVSGVRIEFNQKFNPTQIDRTVMVLSNAEHSESNQAPSDPEDPSDFEPTDSDCA